MKNLNVCKSKYFINTMFFVYFVLLFAERMISLIRSLINGVNYFANGFNGFVYTVTMLSLALTVCFLLIFERKIFIAPFTRDENVHNVNYTVLVYAVGIELFSGMMHTEYTLSFLQFISYGALIVGLVIRTVLSQKEKVNKVLLWLSLIYLVSFSMAIPVMYSTGIKNYVLYYFTEAITTSLLIVCFTCMTKKVMTGGKTAENLFSIIPILLAVIGDTLIISLSWNDKINTFVLIFALLSAVIWIVGKTFSLLQNKKNDKTEQSI